MILGAGGGGMYYYQKQMKESQAEVAAANNGKEVSTTTTKNNDNKGWFGGRFARDTKDENGETVKDGEEQVGTNKDGNANKVEGKAATKKKGWGFKMPDLPSAEGIQMAVAKQSMKMKMGG